MKRVLSILALLGVCLSVLAWNPPHRHGVPHSDVTPELLLLDELASEQGITNGQFLVAPAYSLRLLSTNYTGKCMTITTNEPDYTAGALFDVGFSNNIVDIAAIETYANGNDAFVVYWYDQGTNDNAAAYAGQGANSAHYHPMIARAGQVITNGTFPAICTTNIIVGFTFGKTAYQDQTYDGGMTYEMSREFMVSWVGKSLGGDALLLACDNTGMHANIPSLSNTWGSYNGGFISASYSASTHGLFVMVSHSYDNVDFYTDNTDMVPVGSGTGYNTDDGKLFFYVANSYVFKGYVSELIRFRTDTNSVVTIKRNTNDKMHVY